MSQHIARAIVSLLLAEVIGGCRTLTAEEIREPTPAVAAHYAAGEIIVKLKPHAGASLNAALHAGHQPPQHTGLAWFDTLARRYGVTKIERVFPHQPALEAIKQKYPQRARRAPPSAKAVNLQYIYKLTFRQDVDIEHAAADYAHHSDVEYAQPNYLAEIQPAQAGSTP
ncbi:MAG: hypothetical protein HY352_06470 [Candidatus Omnitrophica bacterium]|nr:hypothetical protein [Candidatus Omnitrophota bacterium]